MNIYVCFGQKFYTQKNKVKNSRIFHFQRTVSRKMQFTSKFSTKNMHIFPTKIIRKFLRYKINKKRRKKRVFLILRRTYRSKWIFRIFLRFLKNTKKRRFLRQKTSENTILSQMSIFTRFFHFDRTVSLKMKFQRYFDVLLCIGFTQRFLQEYTQKCIE